MKLKERILHKAIELFNEKGIANVSPNQIAAALKISPGNLTYHYKTKAMLISQIYENMDQDAQSHMIVDGNPSLSDFWLIMNNFQQYQRRYRFFFHDVVFISRNYPEVSKQYEATNLKRFALGRKLIDHYIKTGVMLPETEGMNYDFLILNLWIVGAFWNSQERIMTSPSPITRPDDFLQMAWNMILPYLSAQGREEHARIEVDH